jgi:hypothetical protein
MEGSEKRIIWYMAAGIAGRSCLRRHEKVSPKERRERGPNTEVQQRRPHARSEFVGTGRKPVLSEYETAEPQKVSKNIHIQIKGTQRRAARLCLCRSAATEHAARREARERSCSEATNDASDKQERYAERSKSTSGERHQFQRFLLCEIHEYTMLYAAQARA